MFSIHRFILLLTVLNLAACTGDIPTPLIETAPEQVEPSLNTVKFPPTWTPTSIPTQPAVTDTPIPSGAHSSDRAFSPLLDLRDATPVAASFSTATWQIVDGATASFMLPTSFKVLDMGSEFGILMAALMTGLMEGMLEVASDLGEELGADPITPAPIDRGEVEAAFNIDFVLAMQDDETTSAFLFSEPLEQSSSLEEQMQATLDEQDNPIEVVSIDRVIDSNYETGRMSLLATDSETGERGHVLIYIILLSDRVYQLGFTTTIDRYEEMSSIFETSASTFRVNPQ